MTDICLIGFGAIGALYGFALERSSTPQGNIRLTVVCRSNYQTVKDNGLEVESDRLGTHPSWRPYRVVSTVEEAADRGYAYIVCAVKCLPDVKPTSAIIEPLLKKLSSYPDTPTSIVLLQNGVGIEDDVLGALAKHGVGSVPVLSGCAWTDTTAVDGGKRIVQHGNERLVIGYHRASPSVGFDETRSQASLDTFVQLLKSGGINVESAPDIDVARWHKVLWNASFSTVCTLTRATVGDVLATAEARTALEDIMLEVLAVARADLPSDAAASLPDSKARAVIENENPASVFKPSMLVDLEAGRPMEIEAIVGDIVRKAAARGLQVPRLETICAGLKVIQRSLIR